MQGKKGEQIKVYIIIGLALVAAIVGYFRFVHKKPTRDADRTPPAVSIARFDVSQVEINNTRNARWREPPVNEALPVVLRDIFVPLKSPKKAQRRPTEQKPSKPLPSLKLSGTIVGGKRPVAIINDQFVRIGDWIGEYKVVRIGKKEVLLDSGNRKIELEMVKKNE
ncbi:unnamed protein product [marine sediment metagenome]|uniref:Type II secretion system protein GspC N-terminal domain-containing protein n=1 Tax=marine sediment metagenome TaxID=412755 RepID=X1VQ92_9ZZZZ